MARRRSHEEPERHEAWAIPYGDLVTLLLAFFVVMYSISSVNEGKYRVVSDSLTEAFHGTPRAPQPINIGETRMQPIQQQLPLSEVNRIIAAGLPAPRLLTQPAAAKPTLEIPNGQNPGTGPAESSRSVVPPGASGGSGRGTVAGGDLSTVADDVGAAMRALLATGQVHIHKHQTWVGIDISTDMLFASGVARLSPTAIPVLERLAETLKSWPNAIRVEGHTDDRPIDTRDFHSNWELSSARAASVVHLFMDRGVDPARLAVLGFGPYRPLVPNTSAAGRNTNRRVEVVILSRDSAPEEGL